MPIRTPSISRRSGASAFVWLEGASNILWLLSILLIAVLAYLGLILLDLKKIIQQLDYIVSKDTNAELTSTSKNGIIRRLLDSNNRLIKQNKIYNQERYHKDKQMQEVITNLTHDLKTPLTVSSGYTQILLQDPKLSQHHAMIQKIDSSLNSISHYLHYLMEYNLIQEKMLTPEFRKIDVSELLTQYLFTYYDELHKKHLSLEIHIQEQQSIITDETILQRIFQNILGNILKYGYRKVLISLEAQQDQLIIQFTNGIAASIENADRLYQRFVTEDPSRSNKNTGLGLSIVKELVKAMDGEITIKTDPEFFYLQLKLKKSRES
ncbi:HAMP domain-containing histidine kinase [Paenibacillus albiflavus]|uniref:histidine kinase n=1 Tax=Paenibacillus albiflavus TaxID=2545760 RepID=A0A4R4EGX2_9BACL|nr:HAMP domain-containing sensor histidine kinase [Paenibacillus albiflavus]TCZ78410.1 HAMP domain-containing histidine kinase [Paenibacillus albiflavus]